MRFITLTEAESGHPELVSVAHIVRVKQYYHQTRGIMQTKLTLVSGFMLVKEDLTTVMSNIMNAGDIDADTV